MPKNKTGLENTETIRLRNQTISLSASDVDDLLKKHDFYDNKRNPEGKGFLHQYREQKKKGDKVIIDDATGLMWQQGGSSNDMEYENANKWIEKFNREGYAGYNDWCIPTLEEAMSLMEQEKGNKGLYINPIFDKDQDWIWTSDLLKGEAQAWVVNFFLGGCYYVDFYENKYVRAVRSVQSSQE